MKQHLTMKEAVALALELDALVRLEQAVLHEHPPDLPPLPPRVLALARASEALGAARREKAAARALEVTLKNVRAGRGDW